MINYVKGSIKEHFTERFKEINSGRPWHSKNISDILEMGENELSNEALKILNHMIAWRRFVIGVLLGEENKIEINSEMDWPPVTSSSDLIKKEFIQTQEDLIVAIERMDDGGWDKRPAGARYSNFQLCQGVIDHDIYHAGQIALLMKTK